MSTWMEPVVLQGQHVRMEPLAPEHAADLNESAADGALPGLWYTSVPDAAHMPGWIDAALADAASGNALAFVVREKGDGRIVGSTRYCHADVANRRVEIGHTWYAARVQRTAVNTECKYLLLRNAFETLRCIAVELRTHHLNRRSRAAIERLGARQDGILRNHRILPDGSYRDTVVYSIIQSEWPAVQRHLDFQLARFS